MNADWLSHLNHQVAAISEGFCPHCSRRLAPIPGALGTTGRCPDCGTWRAWSERERRDEDHDTWTAWTAPEETRD